MKIPKILFIALMIAVVFTGCQKQEVERPQGPQAIPVKVMKVELKDLNRVLEYVGSVRGQDEANIYPKVTGKIIEKVKQEGDFVNKGDAVAYIDRDEVGLKFEKAPVESPITGVIGTVYVDVGSNVSPQTPVALAVNMDKVRVYVSIPEQYTSKLSLGKEARVSVDAFPEQEFTGAITKINPVLDAQTRASIVEILVDNKDHLLRSGMFAKIDLIIDEQKNVPAILKEAVIGKNSDVWVYVAEGEKASLRKVKLGIRQGPYYAVLEGLQEGDLVVIMGQQKLYDGALVKVEMQEQGQEEIK